MLNDEKKDKKSFLNTILNTKTKPSHADFYGDDLKFWIYGSVVIILLMIVLLLEYFGIID